MALLNGILRDYSQNIYFLVLNKCTFTLFIMGKSSVGHVHPFSSQMGHAHLPQRQPWWNTSCHHYVQRMSKNNDDNNEGTDSDIFPYSILIYIYIYNDNGNIIRSYSITITLTFSLVRNGLGRWDSWSRKTWSNHPFWTMIAVANDE